jgi:hypothetical protein
MTITNVDENMPHKTPPKRKFRRKGKSVLNSKSRSKSKLRVKEPNSDLQTLQID